MSLRLDYATMSVAYPNVFYPSAPVKKYVLETATGFARAHKVKLGTRLGLQNFPLVSE